MKTDFIIILVTCVSKKEAENIVNALLKKRLIACGNVISGVESKFWWKKRIDNAKEALILLKAKRKDFKNIEKEITRIHSYEIPEVIAIPIIAGSEKYLDWLKEETCARGS